MLGLLVQLISTILVTYCLSIVHTYLAAAYLITVLSGVATAIMQYYEQKTKIDDFNKAMDKLKRKMEGKPPFDVINGEKEDDKPKH